MSKQVINASQAPAAVGPYSHAVVVPAGKLVFVSGQIGLDPKTGNLVTSSFEDQVKQAFANLEAVVTASGGSLQNIVKLTLFLTDLSNFSTVNDIMAQVIPQPFPARSTLGVASLPKAGDFEVEAILAL